MTDKHVNAIIRIIYILATMLILAGVIFRMKHFPIGTSLFFIGFFIGSVATIFNTIRLKRKNKKLEEQLREKE